MAGNCPEFVRKLYRSGAVPLKSWPENWDRERRVVYISTVSRAENLGQKAQNLNAVALSGQSMHAVNEDAFPMVAPNSFHEKADRSQDGFVFLSVNPNLFTEPPLSPSFHPQSLLSDARSLPVGRP
jgi:hypothetical protein